MGVSCLFALSLTTKQGQFSKVSIWNKSAYHVLLMKAPFARVAVTL